MDELIRHPPGTAQEEVDARQEQEEQLIDQEATVYYSVGLKVLDQMGSIVDNVQSYPKSSTSTVTLPVVKYWRQFLLFGFDHRPFGYSEKSSYLPPRPHC